MLNRLCYCNRMCNLCWTFVVLVFVYMLKDKVNHSTSIIRNEILQGCRSRNSNCSKTRLKGIHKLATRSCQSVFLRRKKMLLNKECAVTEPRKKFSTVWSHRSLIIWRIYDCLPDSSSVQWYSLSLAGAF